MAHRVLTTVVAAALVATSVVADDVYLKSGGVFENVVAVVSEEQVRVLLPIGEMVLPAAQVLRVEVADSPFAQYLVRRDRLLREAATAAEEWLELARWSRVQGLDRGHREAALHAADLAPNLEGLAPVMRGLDYTFEPELVRWLPHADAMHRRGLVQLDGEWLDRDERARRLAAGRHRDGRSR